MQFLPTFHFTPENWPHHIIVWCDQFTPHGHMTLQWATVSHVQRSKWSESSLVVSDSLWPHGLYSPWNSPGQNTEWVAFPFSRGSSQPRDRTQVSRIAGRFFTCCATREAQEVKRLWILINNGNAQHRHFWFFSFSFVEGRAVYRVQCNLSEPSIWLMKYCRARAQEFLWLRYFLIFWLPR